VRRCVWKAIRRGSKKATSFNTYGFVDNKQAYIYGGLDFSPTLLNRAFDIKLTKANVEYTVSAIKHRDSRMISKKISLRSSFLFMRGYAAYGSYSTLLQPKIDENGATKCRI